MRKSIQVQTLLFAAWICRLSVDSFSFPFISSRSFPQQLPRSPSSFARRGHPWFLNARADDDDEGIKSQEDVSNDDDGWGSSSSSLKQSKLKELQALQQSESADTSTTARPSSIDPPSEDRDLFIPIFALVSLAGLFGAYGYEMLRLYSRGELYLPWNN